MVKKKGVGMNKIIILLCLVLAGCSTISVNSKALCKTTDKAEVVAKTAPITVSMDQKELDSMIAVFSEAIKNNPNYVGAYYNRAAVYFYKNNYDKSWLDIHKAEALGINVDSKFIELVDKLKKASGRER